MAIIIHQSFDYLVELGVLPVNHFAEFKINASLFTPPKPKEAAERGCCTDQSLFGASGIGACGFAVERLKGRLTADQTHGAEAMGTVAGRYMESISDRGRPY